MPIQTSFKFAQMRAGSQLLEAQFVATDRLGPLRGLVGKAAHNDAKRTWRGSGFNMIWRPNFGNASGSQAHFLQLNLTDETLAFTEISGNTGIANRGALQPDIFLGGVAYLQTINDAFDNTGQHFEPGVFNFVPATRNPAEPEAITRLGSIPHGTTINLQGQAFEANQPVFDLASIVPFRTGAVDDGATDLFHFPEEDLAVQLDSRTALSRVPGLTQAQMANPNLFLAQTNAGLTINKTTVLTLSSDSTLPGAVPDAGGGVDNIAFLQGTAAGPNAAAPRVTSTFWIEEGVDSAGAPFVQLQYTQRVLLDFNGLSWPHISVGTLRPE